MIDENCIDKDVRIETLQNKLDERKRLEMLHGELSMRMITKSHYMETINKYISIISLEDQVELLEHVDKTYNIAMKLCEKYGFGNKKRKKGVYNDD